MDPNYGTQRRRKWQDPKDQPTRGRPNPNRHPITETRFLQIELVVKQKKIKKIMHANRVLNKKYTGLMI